MGLFDLMASEPKPPESRDPRDEFWFQRLGSGSEHGVPVTVERARLVPVVKDCVDTLAQSVSSLQFGIFERLNNGQAKRHDRHPIVQLMRNPNSRNTTVEFVQMIATDLSQSGDFVAKKIWSRGGILTELRRIDPELGYFDELADGTKRFKYTDKFGQSHVLLEDEMWHIPRPPVVDDVRGTSPILDDGREAVGVAIALQRYANALFTNDATPSFVWAMPQGQNFKSDTDKKNFLGSIARWMGGKNRHKPAVIEYGIEPKRLGLTSEEAQFLETRRELWLDLTRLWHMPPHKVGIMDRATFSNIEHQSIEYVIDTVRPVLELIEASINKHLIEDESFFFEFNVRSLLRGDLKARYEAYALGRQWGWLSVNDVLRMENENGIGAHGDRYMEPLNMVPVGSDRARRENQEGVNKAISFLHGSVGGRPRLEILQDAA